MYNRYLPNGNGQHRRQAVPESPKPPAPQNTQTCSDVPPQRAERSAPVTHCAPPAFSTPTNYGAPQFHLPFLDRLNLDSGDLLLLSVMLLLLAEGNEDSASVVMTLAIFLFLQ